MNVEWANVVRSYKNKVRAKPHASPAFIFYSCCALLQSTSSPLTACRGCCVHLYHVHTRGFHVRGLRDQLSTIGVGGVKMPSWTLRGSWQTQRRFWGEDRVKITHPNVSPQLDKKGQLSPHTPSVHVTGMLYKCTNPPPPLFTTTNIASIPVSAALSLNDFKQGRRYGSQTLLTYMQGDFTIKAEGIFFFSL